MALRLGIDVGGTNTDAALLEDQQVLATAKTTTTPDTVSGIMHALQKLAEKLPAGLQTLASCQAVMLGTTKFVNAVIEHKSLSKVFVVRLCGTATAALPPFVGMSQQLTTMIKGGYLLASGGFEYDGTTEISPLCTTDAAAAAQQLLAAGAEAAVVCGVHAPVNPSQELAFADLLQQQLQQLAPGCPVYITLSHKLSGRLGLLEREAAAILNAALQPLAAAVMPQYSAAFAQLGLQDTPLYMTGNDGTLLTAAAAQQYPVLTFRSGPVNSVRGAAYLAGVKDALVCDIGGTTTDIGAVVQGMPRMCGAFVDICGVTTNFRMPDVTSFGLGGGSLVVWQPAEQQQQSIERQQLRQCSIGPGSVGSALTSSCLVCGGGTCTASDVAVLLHDRLPELISKQAAESRLVGKQQPAPSQQQLQTAWQAMQDQLGAAVDAAKSSAAPVPLVVVGGGAGLCCDSLPGVSNIIRPLHAEVANAVGAAIPQVAGTLDTLVSMSSSPEIRQQQIAEAVQQATAAAVAAGAQGDRCEVVEMEEVPVAYGPAGSTRLHIKVVGQLQLGTSAAAAAAAALPVADLDRSAAFPEPAAEQTAATVAATAPAAAAGAISSSHPAAPYMFTYSLQQLQQYKPHINPQGLWEVSSLDLDAMAIGAQVLGAGGGGSARHNRLKLEHAITCGGGAAAAAGAATGHIGGDIADDAAAASASSIPGGSSSSSSKLTRPVILHLQDLPDNVVVCDVGGMGAPTVSAEKLDSHECSAAVRGLSAALPRAISALLCAEVGGGNALEPLAVGLERGLPVVDADLMGRAFPELQMSTAAIAGVSLTPAAVADDKGNVLVMSAAASPLWAEKVLRAACTEMGCSMGLASTPMEGKLAKEVVVPGSLSLAWRIGMAIMTARAAKADPVAAVLKLYQGSGQLLYQGKVVDVERDTAGGFVRGHLTIAAKQAARQHTSSTSVTQPATAATAAPAPAATGAGGAEGAQQQLQPELAELVAADGDSLTIDFQNENLVAKTATGQVVACVPDLICCVDSSSGEAVATEELRYGLFVSVLVLPAHPLLTTPAALEVVGPAAFGYGSDVVYRAVGKCPSMATVHELFGSRQP